MQYRTITSVQLRSNGACERQVAKFERYFGKEVHVTQKLARRVTFIFNFIWAVNNLLTPRQYSIWRREFNKINKQCDKKLNKLRIRIPVYPWWVFLTKKRTLTKRRDRDYSAAFAKAYNS